jgi:hypothetical protein
MELRNKKFKYMVTFYLLLASSSIAIAYPITPQTLRKLIEQSSYIVIARVDNPEKGEKWIDPKTGDTLLSYTFGGDGLADLYIKEVLKGNTYTNHIQVTYEAGMSNPRPPFYPDTKTVIAFLNKEDSATTYYTYGLSYGTKIMESEAEMNVYKTRIVEYLEILKLKNKREKKQATIEWLVKCAENEYTRWNGVYDLSRQGHYIAFYDLSKDEKLYKKLNTSQILRLDSIYFATDTIGFTELCLVKLIPEEHHARLKAHLLRNLSFADYFLQYDITEQIIRIFPDKELKKIYEKLSDNRYDKEKESVWRELIEQFIARAQNT